METFAVKGKFLDLAWKSVVVKNNDGPYEVL